MDRGALGSSGRVSSRSVAHRDADGVSEAQPSGDRAYVTQMVSVSCPLAPPELSTQVAKALFGLLAAVAESDRLARVGRHRVA